MEFEKNKKKKIVIILTLLVAIIIVLYMLVSFLSVKYSIPVEALRREKLHVSRRILKKLDSSYEISLNSKRVDKEKITYYPKTYYVQDNTYIGNFISDDDYVYEFRFFLDTGETKLIEYSKNYGIIKYQVESAGKEGSK